MRESSWPRRSLSLWQCSTQALDASLLLRSVLLWSLAALILARALTPPRVRRPAVMPGPAYKRTTRRARQLQPARRRCARQTSVWHRVGRRARQPGRQVEIVRGRRLPCARWARLPAQRAEGGICGRNVCAARRRCVPLPAEPLPRGGEPRRAASATTRQRGRRASAAAGRGGPDSVGRALAPAGHERWRRHPARPLLRRHTGCAVEYSSGAGTSTPAANLLMRYNARARRAAAAAVAAASAVAAAAAGPAAAATAVPSPPPPLPR